MKTVKFNVNNNVSVKLTEYGKKCLRRNYDELAASYNGKLAWEFSLPKEDSEGWSKWQTHSLMEQLGRYMEVGFDCQFHPIIRIEIDDDPIQFHQAKEIHHHHHYQQPPIPSGPIPPWVVTCKAP